MKTKEAKEKMFQINWRKSGISQMVTGLLLMACLFLQTGCHSTQTAQKDTGTNPVVKTDNAYKQKVVSNRQKTKAITGKMKLDLSMGDKNVSLSGNLRMMRDDVIQLSLSFLGMEVARMEFTKEDVLILDRVHRQYAKVGYSSIDFLRSANLDFNALQALFWNEIFVPGQTDVLGSLNQFRVSESGSHTLLILTSAPRLDYSFLTTTATALLNRTIVNPKNSQTQDNLVCRYSNFVKLAGKSFPASISLAFKGDKKTYTLNMTLSNLDNATNWQTRTQVSSKYSQMNINALLDKLSFN